MNSRVSLQTLLCLLIMFLPNGAWAQVTTGIAAGWVVAQSGDEFDDITPGENSTAVNVGPGLFQVPVPITQTSPNGAAWAQTEFPDVRVVVDSTVIGMPPNFVAYGGAYFSDAITLTGGSGMVTTTLRWDFEGAISGAGGNGFVGSVPPTGGPFQGRAAANFRVFLEPYGDGMQDLSETDFFKDFALEPYSQFSNPFLDVPYFDPLDPFSGGGSGPSGGNFLFNEYDEVGNPTGGLVGGYFTDENAGLIAGIGGGAQVTVQYGVPFRYAVLLEGWASDGGIVNFGNTGSITTITVPAGTAVSSQGGATYDVQYTSQCDLNNDSQCDSGDLRSLYDDISSGTMGGAADLDGNGIVDNGDIPVWLTDAGSRNGKTYLPGDANLDGNVGGADFTTLASGFGATGLPGAYWDQGNFNGKNAGGNFAVGGDDFTSLAANFGSTSAITAGPPTTIFRESVVGATSVPEPGLMAMVFGMLLCRICRVGRRAER